MSKEQSGKDKRKELQKSFTESAENEEDLNQKNFKYSKLNPKKLFELVSNNYESWQHAMNKQFEDEDNFLPFPQEDDAESGISDKPIFDYSLMDQLDQEVDQDDDAAFESVVRFNQVMREKLQSEEMKDKSDMSAVTNQDKLASLAEALENLNVLELATSIINKPTIPTNELLNENDMDLLRHKIASMIGNAHANGNQEQETEFDIDIDIIHNQDDYDVDEIIDDNYSYAKPEYDEGPSCEFTFEYDNQGKLVPTYNNVEEKLQILQNKMKLPSINELNLKEPEKKPKKKNKKKSEKNNSHDSHNNTTNHVEGPIQGGLIMNSNCCPICEYEVVFGHKPRQLIKLYNQRIEKDEARRLEIKKKLENAKLKAMKKQRELKQRQQQQLQQHEASNQPNKSASPPSSTSPIPISTPKIASST